MKVIDSFFNWQNDIPWGWGPLEYLRPPKDKEIDRHLFVQLCCGTMLIGTPIFFLTMLFMRYCPVFFDPHIRLSPSMIVAMSFRVIREFWWFLTLLVVVYIPFAWWPYVHFWNKRAVLLRNTPKQDHPDENGGETATIWPPAPKQPLQ